MVRSLCLITVLVYAASPVFAQEPSFQPVDGSPAAMSKLAADVIAVYRDGDRDRYLNTLFRLQMVAGRHADAIATIHAVRELRSGGVPARTAWLYTQHEVVATARARQADRSEAPDAAFTEASREVLGSLDDRAAMSAAFGFGGSLSRFEGDLQSALDAQKAQTSLALADAVELLRRYQVYDAYRELLPRGAALVAADDARRYVIDRDVLVSTPDGARIAVKIFRPRVATRQTTLFGFTIYANDEWSDADAKRGAANGYAGVVAYSRGKGRSPDAIAPYEHDGDDARAVIDWIARQPWSDGRVGMYGGSYNGFAAWSAAKKLPKALKCLMTSATAAPGIDVPMQGNVFMNFLYPWLPYVANSKALDDAAYGDQARWSALNRSWYTTGNAYRDLDRIDGHPSPMWRRWLEHPGYDAYWQRMIPYRDEFARIDIPVLQTTGYFDGAMVGALYYFREHTKYRPKADHTIVVGPFEHFSMQSGVPRVVQGYEVDPVGIIDLNQLRQDWFDYVLKGAPKPDLLKDRVNYQVLGANVWKHAPSLEAMSNSRRRMFLSATREGDTLKFADASAKGPDIVQTVDFSNRTDADYTTSPLSLTPKLDTHNGIAYATAPVTEQTEISGLFSGELDFVVNKRDFDVTVTMYEKMPTGEYLLLASHMARASYAKDRNRRQLLVPNRPQRLTFMAERMTSRLLQPGSRIVVVVSINRQPDMQINYGTGRDVSSETIADAKVPLHIRWLPSSWIEVPVAR